MADPPKSAKSYLAKLHRWVVYWDKKLKRVKWSKIPRKSGTPISDNGGAGGSPPPPSWPP